MKKKIITGGCSFTFNEGSWASHIPNVVNVARGGSGPVTSVREVMIKLQETEGEKICIFQVSNPCRKEIIINSDNQYLFHLDDSKIKYYDRNICGTDYTQLKGFGGQGYDPKHEAQYNINSFHKQARQNIALAISDEQKTVESYEMLMLLQLYCKAHSIPLLMFYGWLDKADFKGQLIAKVLKGIDWSVWWQQGEETMSSWLHQNGHKDRKGMPIDAQNKVRPTLEGHKHFYHEIIKPWIQNQLK